MSYVVVENTPGYLPENEGAEFDSRVEAEDYAETLAAEAAESIAAWEERRPTVTRESPTLWRITTGAEHDLGRVVEIIEA
jgi:hypothetical protein